VFVLFGKTEDKNQRFLDTIEYLDIENTDKGFSFIHLNKSSSIENAWFENFGSF
jgi:hypothetical protein